MSKGGSLRKPVPNVDSHDLLKVMEEYVNIKGANNAFVLGPYDRIKRSQAANGPGLSNNADLLSALLSVAPAGQVKAGVLRGHLMTLALKYKFMSSWCPQAAKVIVCHKADCIMTMLSHLRRIRMDSGRVREMQHKAAYADVLAVEKLCNMLELPHAPALDIASERGPVSPVAGLTKHTCSTLWANYTAADWTALQLACDAELCKAALCQMSSSSLFHSDVAQAQVASNAAPMATVPKRPSAVGDAAVAWTCSSKGKLYLTKAAESSYIRIKLGVDRYKVLATISESRCHNHKVVISRLAAWMLQQPSLTVEQIAKQKDRLVKSSC